MSLFGGGDGGFGVAAGVDRTGVQPTKLARGNVRSWCVHRAYIRVYVSEYEHYRIHRA